MGETASERITIRRRVPGIFRFQALLSFGLSVWMFNPFPVTRAGWINVLEILAMLWLGTLAVFALYLDGKVSYTSEGFYIRPLGWRPLVGLAREHFVAFEEIMKITPEFPRGGHGTQDWLMFGILQLHTNRRQGDADELILYQAFLNRWELAEVLQSLANARPGIIDQSVINSLAATT